MIISINTSNGRVKMQYAIVSDKGLREHNEDSVGYKVIGDRAVFVVADGLGGHDKGEVASAMAVDTFLRIFEDEYNPNDYISKSMQTAQQEILTAQETVPANANMKTTVVCIVIDGDRYKYANVGDSRLYVVDRVADNVRVARLTKDHSVPQLLVETGEIDEREIRFHPDRNRLLRALGSEMRENFWNESEWQPLENAEGFLLCSDGLWEGVMDIEILNAFTKRNNAEETCEYIKEQVVRHLEDTMDNYSGIIIRK